MQLNQPCMNRVSCLNRGFFKFHLRCSLNSVINHPQTWGHVKFVEKKGEETLSSPVSQTSAVIFFKDSAVNFIMVLSVIAIKSVLFHKYHNVNKLFLCVYLLPSFMFNSNLYKLYLYPLMFILLLGRINIYKVVISVCLSVCLSERGCSFISKGATIFCLDLSLHVFL